MSSKQTTQDKRQQEKNKKTLQDAHIKKRPRTHQEQNTQQEQN